MKKCKFLLLLSVWMLFGLTGQTRAIGAEPSITLTSLDWAPYSGADLLEQGASSAVARAAFAAMGYHLNIAFYPWSRAVQLARTDDRVMGYMPEYYSPEVAAHFILSHPIGSGPLALAQRRNHPIQWRAIGDLSAWRVGVVQGYVNDPAFDARVAAHLQPVDVAISDELNLKKLAAGRIDVAIVDPYVFDYLCAQHPELARQLEINPHMIANKDLYIAFKRTAAGARWAAIFNQGLRKIDITAIMRRFIKDYREPVGAVPHARGAAG